MHPAVVICLGVLIALGIVERLVRDRAWRTVPIRIHVNGTRGKSTVTRLIWAALREAGIPALAKTTGTEPRLLLPDGKETVLKRRGRTNIREQLRTLLLAKKKGARAIVLECMAIHPELQWISEHALICSTIGVITNVRMDHMEVMGDCLEEIAKSLANTVPAKATLVVGDSRCLSIFETKASKMDTRVVIAGKDIGDYSHSAAIPGWLSENYGTALAVTRTLGIPDSVAVAGMSKDLTNPAFEGLGMDRTLGRGPHYLDATAANDPESFLAVLESFTGRLQAPLTGASESPSRQAGILVYNHRSDRPARLLHFVTHVFSALPTWAIVITGNRPTLSLWLAIRQIGVGKRIAFVGSRQLASHLDGSLPRPEAIAFCGNTRGLYPHAIIERGYHG